MPSPGQPARAAVVTAGLDVGSGSVKAVVMAFGDGAGGAAGAAAAAAGGDAGPSSADHGARVLAKASARIRKRDIADVVGEVFAQATTQARVEAIDYVATTGEGEDIPFATGHFYGMTTHARGALFLQPRATSVLDAGALHARAVAMDRRGKVLDYKMTSQCASGSGQFLENIARYLGVSQAEIGPLSLQADDPERVSGICAVLAETDVINMVSRGISTANILRGIHESMSGRFARLLRSLEHGPVIFVSGGLAGDVGLLKALADEFAALEDRGGPPPEISAHPDSIFAGALGAAIWGRFRHERLGRAEPAWRRA